MVNGRTFKKICRTLRRVVIFIALIFLLTPSVVALFHSIVPLYEFSVLQEKSFADHELFRTIGTYLGGVLSPLIAALVLALLFDSYFLQKKELTTMTRIASKTAQINKKNLIQQESLAVQQADNAEKEFELQEKAFLMSQINQQLDRMRDELKELKSTVFFNDDPDRASVPAKDLFTFPFKEPLNSEYLKSLNLHQVQSYVTQLAFHGFDAIRFLELGGQYHHRASQFDELLKLLMPFHRGHHEFTEFAKTFQLAAPDISLLAQAFIKLAELRGIQEREVKNNLVTLYPRAEKAG